MEGEKNERKARQDDVQNQLMLIGQRLRRMKNKKRVLDFWPVVCIVHCGSIFIYVLQWKMTSLSSHPQMKPGADRHKDYLS